MRGAATGGITALLTLSACGKDSARGGLHVELDAARARWAAEALPAYAVTQRLSCFCPPPRAWTVVVIGGVPAFIESVEPTGRSEDRLLERSAFEMSTSVEDLFDWIERNIETAARLDVTFDPERGYPTSVSADPIGGAVDDEIAWELSDLVPVGPCTEIGCQDALRLALLPSGGRVTPGEYVVTVSPAGGLPASCAFLVTVGGVCASSFCVQGGDGCAFPLSAPDGLRVSFPVLDGPLDVTVTIDGSTVASESLDPAYARSQPNGPLCPPVCWSADAEVALP